MTKKAQVAARQRVVASKGGKAEAEPASKPRKITRSAKDGGIVSPVGADPDTTLKQEVMSPLERFLKDFKLPKIPKTGGPMADLLYTAREDRLKLQKIVDQIEETEKSLKAHFIDTLSKNDSTGVAGKRARVQVNEDTVAQVEDWDSFYKHISKTKEFDLLNRAVNRKAVEARWDAGKAVPGVKRQPIKKVSVTKV